MESDSLQLISSSLSEFSSLAAFGDFNNDKLTDVVVYSNNQQKITILTSLKNTFTVYKSFSYSLNNVNLTIINVIPIDFNYDGVLDLMLFGDGNSKIYIRVILSDGTIIELPPSTSAQPFITDFYGDLRPHLIGFPSDNDFLSIWSRSGNTTRIVLNLKPACKFAHPNSNAFIDIDGDCLPDLVFFCDDETVQIWLNRKGNWQATKDLKMPSGSGKVSFADIDGDGSNDLVFPSCGFFSSCFINISYNRQIQRNLDQLFISDPEFSFAFEGDVYHF